MSEHLLIDIEIKDFKCFKDFKAEGFKRVNLIGGKNNVGKTAFMEACFVNVNSIDINSFSFALAYLHMMRNQLEFIGKENNKIFNIFKEALNDILYSVKTNIHDLNFMLNDEDGVKEYNFMLNDYNRIININDFSMGRLTNSNMKFIDNVGLSNLGLKDVFESVQKKDKEEILYKYINEFDNNIYNFKILGGDNPSCKVIDRNEYQSINEFGDGLKHYISIICSLYACENGYLFIDEIDNGIHYTQLDRLWEIILTISKEQNVQVFSTTHSKECIESFARVSKELEDKNISFIELGKNKNNKLDSIVYTYEMFQSEIKQNHGVRGW